MWGSDAEKIGDLQNFGEHILTHIAFFSCHFRPPFFDLPPCKILLFRSGLLPPHAIANEKQVSCRVGGQQIVEPSCFDSLCICVSSRFGSLTELMAIGRFMSLLCSSQLQLQMTPRAKTLSNSVLIGLKAASLDFKGTAT